MKPLTRQELDELVTRMRDALEVIIRLCDAPVDVSLTGTITELAVQLRLESIRVEALGGLGSLKAK